LEFSFQPDVEISQVDNFPASELPFTVIPIVLNTKQNVVRVMVDFAGLGLWLVVECA